MLTNIIKCIMQDISRGMFFTGSNRQMFPMTVAFNAYHAKFLIKSVFPHGYITRENEEIKMVKQTKLKMRTASNFTTRRGKNHRRI